MNNTVEKRLFGLIRRDHFLSIDCVDLDLRLGLLLDNETRSGRDVKHVCQC